MIAVDWVGPDDPRWTACLRGAAEHDLYHRPDYHVVAARCEDAAPRLVLATDGDRFLALPLLVRPIPDEILLANGGPLAGEGLWDATSAYGYTGPLASPGLDADAAARMIGAIRGFLADERIVTVFTRLHPLLDQRPLLGGEGELVEHGETVSIDLTPAEAQQRAAYVHNHRRGLRRLAASGVVLEHDRELRHLETFVEIYHATMRRVGAKPFYFFDHDYFTELTARLGEHLLLLHAVQEGRILASAMFFVTGGIAQYHLSGTREEALKLAPMKLLVDGARDLLASRGARVLHLGGGLGAAQDSLFAFKAGFSRSRHAFCSWRWIVRPEDYARLARGRDPGGFFPAYRAPRSEPASLERADTETV